MATEAQHITAVLNVLRGKLGLGESPPGSNYNEIVKWYNKNVDPIGNGAWCEMTDTWAMWTGGAKELKKGRAYTVWACQDAQKGVNGSSWHWGTKGMKAGDQVYYDWAGKKKDVGAVDHTGTVEKINGDGTFYALEGNTSDKLLRKHRDGTYVVGYVRFAWSRLAGKSTPSPSPSTPSSPQRDDLEVDGKLGPLTITKWQQVMGTPVDGVISSPSDLVRAVQRRLNATVDHRLVIDGYGIKQDNHRYKTVGALQRYLGSPVDEVMSSPVSLVVKALQRRLNSGKF
jgi:hypothetical protein